MLHHVAYDLFDVRPHFDQFSVLFVLKCDAVVHFYRLALSLCDLVFGLLSCQTQVMLEHLLLLQFASHHFDLIPV